MENNEPVGTGTCEVCGEQHDRKAQKSPQGPSRFCSGICYARSPDRKIAKSEQAKTRRITKVKTGQTQYKEGATMYVHRCAVTIISAYQFGRHELAYRVREFKYMVPHDVLTTFARERSVRL